MEKETIWNYIWKLCFPCIMVRKERKWNYMRRREEKASVIGWILFLIYLAVLVWIILFKFAFSWGDVPHYRGINLIPYGDSLIINEKLDISELWKNVLAFIPFGIYLGILMPKGNFVKKIAVIAAASLILEMLQYVFSIGASDITDIINNTIGGVLGLLIYAFFSFIFGKRTNRILCRIAFICTLIILIILILLIVLIYSNS